MTNSTSRPKPFTPWASKPRVTARAEALVERALGKLLELAWRGEQRAAQVVDRIQSLRRTAGPLGKARPRSGELVDHIEVRVHQVEVPVDADTRDNAHVRLPLAVQYYPLPGHASKGPTQRSEIEALIGNVAAEALRKQLAQVALSEVYPREGALTEHVSKELDSTVHASGYGLFRVSTVGPEWAATSELRRGTNGAEVRRGATR